MWWFNGQFKVKCERAWLPWTLNSRRQWCFRNGCPWIMAIAEGEEIVYAKFVEIQFSICKWLTLVQWLLVDLHSCTTVYIQFQVHWSTPCPSHHTPPPLPVWGMDDLTSNTALEWWILIHTTRADLDFWCCCFFWRWYHWKKTTWQSSYCFMKSDFH